MSNRSLRSPGTSHEPNNLSPRFRREVDYYLLNDGSDEEAVPEDRLPKVPRLDSESTIDGSVDNVARTDVLPEESASQVVEDTSVAGSTSDTSKRSRARPVTEWLWAYFTITELPNKHALATIPFVFFFVVIRCKVPKCVKKFEPKSYLAEPRTGRESRAL
ncbi:hypothetical protein POJ06DRAFT_262939 [Lipomyces tetrasporus]|uniref:Uncharacterized protein n=1 Tax=Lipomyces tetrasporus TaxID=54092 RepID=A0AAD7VPZ2_9ASCO|nr:uncharacterized protein POJ06DRAFT_262939 [Lipomyces tetrasporus]KAJ8096610.1 hypothetical protein POJ06DRAFT_262939 [Lipomyces tetrasporus]